MEALTPEGTSTATTGTPAALMRSIMRATSSRGASWSPIPSSASTITSGSPSSPKPSTSTTSRPHSRSTRAQTRPSPPLLPRAADHRHPAREPLQHDVGHRPPGPLHQLVERAAVRLLGLPRLRGARAAAAGPSPRPHGRDRRRQRARVGDRDLDLGGVELERAPRVQPLRTTLGFPGPEISISRQVNGTPVPSALPTASLAANRPA